ncbi:hypothetical protein C0993_008162 [Termitomyces sp. T159_Od127]|nr:hypothetical protein C0993_008162 [Termitomyces sp. T159_Od127]
MVFWHNGGVQLAMPSLDGQKPSKDQLPELYQQFIRAALQILKGEQIRVETGGREESADLVDEVKRWAYNLELFRSYSWNIDMHPLMYWKALSTDSNSHQLARIAIKVFSISPSKICDERTASKLGWFNAARRSSMSPKSIIECTKLHDFYMHGLSNGDSDHKAHIHVPKIIVTESSSVEAAQTYSAPTLMDLINEDSISRANIDQARIEAIWF